MLTKEQKIKHFKSLMYIYLGLYFSLSFLLLSCLPRINSKVSEIDSYLIDLPKVRDAREAEWGDVLTDIVQHYYDHNQVMACLPYTNYQAKDNQSSNESFYLNSSSTAGLTDPLTYAHEATHGLNSCIANKYGMGDSLAGFYLLNGKGIYLSNKISMSRYSIAESGLIPQTFRNLDETKRYDTYITRQEKELTSKSPLYIFDEWVAYINDASEAINLLENKKSLSGAQGQTSIGAGAVEFTVYSTAVGLALEKQEPSYLKEEPKFLALYKYLADVVAKKIITSSHNQVIDYKVKEYWNNFKTDSSAQDLRSWIIKNFGSDWSKEVFGFEKP